MTREACSALGGMGLGIRTRCPFRTQSIASASLFELAKRRQGSSPEASSDRRFPVDQRVSGLPSERGRDGAPPHCPQPAMAGLVSHLRTGEKPPFSLRSGKSARRPGPRQDPPTRPRRRTA
jgi:hypothetical protein